MMDDKLNVVDDIIEKGCCYVIDVFPGIVNNPLTFDWIETLLLKKIYKTRMINNIVGILIKSMGYFNARLVITESSLKYRRIKDNILVTDINAKIFYKYMRIALLKDKHVTVLFEDEQIVLDLQLYNTAIYLKNREYVEFFKLIVTSEGLFMREVENK